MTMMLTTIDHDNDNGDGDNNEGNDSDHRVRDIESG